MSWTPNPGDKVTSPLLVGEWEVTGAWGMYAQRVVRDGAVAHVLTSDLTPVAPPLPPEPAVGSVVRAHGGYWARSQHGDWGSPGIEYWRVWSVLATAPDLSPVVAVGDVAEWLRRVDYHGAANAIEGEFGWDQDGAR